MEEKKKKMMEEELPKEHQAKCEKRCCKDHNKKHEHHHECECQKETENKTKELNEKVLRLSAEMQNMRRRYEEEKASIGLISLPPNENIPFKPTLAEEFQLHIPSSYKKIQFDSVRADAQNRMLIDKMGQSVLTPSGSSFLQA